MKNKHVSILFVLLIFISSCSPSFVKNKEAREDAMAFDAANEAQSEITNTVYPSVETSPVICDATEDDAADDPAIWYDQKSPSSSVIFGSNKKGGIHVYNLDGEELQFVPCGKINNIDVRQDVIFGGEQIDILAGSNRTDRSVDLYRILPNGRIDTTMLGKIGLGKMKPYGLCLGKSNNNLLHMYVNDKKGSIVHFSVNAGGDLSNLIIRKLKVETQTEGMVVDDQKGKLYIGEEQKGIWVAEAFDSESNNKEFFYTSTDSNPFISFDVEGLALLPPHYLVASSQGNFSYAVFDTNTKEYVTSFKIKSIDRIDGVEETDGIDILLKPLNDQFPKGVFIAQDGFNHENSNLLNQNFKMVAIDGVLNFLNTTPSN